MKTWISRPLLVGSSCLLCAMFVAAGESPTKGTVSAKKAGLPGKVVGIVVMDHGELVRDKNQKMPAGSVYFCQGENDNRWFYVPGGKKPQIGGLFLSVGDSSKNRKRFNNLTIASESSVKAMGITSPITLVELEVNAGLGSPANEPFLASRMHVVEGSREYPLRSAKALEMVQAHFRTYARAQKSELESLFSVAERKAIQSTKPTSTRQTRDFVHANWLPDTKQLQIHLTQELSNQQSRKVKLATEPQPQSDLQSKPPEREVERGISYGVRVGVTYTISRRGEVEKTQPHAPKAFQEPLKGKSQGLPTAQFASGRKNP